MGSSGLEIYLIICHFIDEQKQALTASQQKIRKIKKIRNRMKIKRWLNQWTQVL
jgi:hypothetical protein